jgi:hypothetical protein
MKAPSSLIPLARLMTKHDGLTSASMLVQKLTMALEGMTSRI